MVAGDVVNIMGAFVGTIFYFQPAASVEVCITWQPSGQSFQTYLYDGVNASVGSPQTASGANSIKIFYTNTIYSKTYSTGIYSALSGIQIK